MYRFNLYSALVGVGLKIIIVSLSCVNCKDCVAGVPLHPEVLYYNEDLRVPIVSTPVSDGMEESRG